MIGEKFFNSGAPLEHLVAVLKASSSTVEALSNKLLETLDQLGLSTDQLVGQALGWCSNLEGGIMGTSQSHKGHVSAGPWCKSHSLRFVMSNTADDSAAAGDCFNKIKKVYTCLYLLLLIGPALLKSIY